MYKRLKSSFICAVFISYVHLAFSQKTDSLVLKSPSILKSLSVSATVHYGFYFWSNVKTDYTINSRPGLAEVDINSQTTGAKIWQQLNGYPVIGLGILFGKSGGDQYIGNIGGLVPFINFTLYKRHRLTLNGKFGIGAGWVQKPFNAQTNYKDLVIGSHLNACINLQVLSGIKIEKRTYLHIGFSLVHFSNGNFKLPNLGLNIPALSAGLEYKFDGQPGLSKTIVPPVRKKWYYSLFTFAALKQTHPLESPLQLVNLASFEMMKNFSNTGRYGLGINLTYDRALSNEIYNSPVFAFDQSKLKLEASIYGAYEYVIGNLSFPMQLGVYVYNNYKISDVYESVGIRYRLASQWTAAVQLKTHLGNADFVQWGAGYKF